MQLSEKLKLKKEKFLLKLKSISQDKTDKTIQGLSSTRNQTFRINILNYNATEVLRELEKEVEGNIEQLNLYNCYCYNNSVSLSRSKAVQENKIYIQDASSMLPVEILKANINDKVLDLCASPGSKTGQLAINTKNQAEIHAVEPVKGRFFKMKDFLDKQGVVISRYYNNSGNYLYKKHPELIRYFDKAIVDVPCSNENSIDLNNLNSFEKWSTKNAKNLSTLQKSILASAFEMLRPGGELVYSTCTFSIKENEGVVDWLLNRFEDVEIININKQVEITGANCFGGLTEHGKYNFSKEVSKSIRIIPDGNFGGFFLCLIRKSL